MREGCSGGGKGPLVSHNVSLTLSTSNDQTLLEKRAARWWDGSDKADTLTCKSDAQRMPDKGRLQCVVDMRKPEAETDGDVSPTLVATDYKGGKAVVEPEGGQVAFSKTARPTEAGGCPKFADTGVANTLNLWDVGETRANELVVVKPPVISLDGDKMGKAERMPDKGRLQCIIEVDGNTDGNETKNPPFAE